MSYLIINILILKEGFMGKSNLSEEIPVQEFIDNDESLEGKSGY